MFDWKSPILAVMGDYLVVKKVFDLVLIFLCRCKHCSCSILFYKILMLTLTGQGHISTKLKTFFTIIYSPIPDNIGLFQKKKLHGLIKNNVEFSGVNKKNHVKFTGILVLGLRIFDRCNTILLSF